MTANAWGENARLTELLWLCTADSGLSGFVGDDQAAADLFQRVCV